MNAEKYIHDILDKELVHIIEKNPYITFQQDNAGCHTAHKVNKYFIEKGISKLEWPSNSPDLNIIENVWKMIKLRLNRKSIKSKNALIYEAQKIWNDLITTDLIEKLAESMPNRINSVLESNGGATKY